MVLTGQVTPTPALSAALGGRRGHVHATWQSDFQSASAGVLGRTTQQDIDIDERGRFVVCGVTREQPVKLHLTYEGAFAADTTVVPLATGLTQSVDWRVGGSPPRR
jgi:hypothetical protein